MKSIAYLSALLFTAVSFALPSLEVGNTAPCVVLDGLDSSGNEVTGCIRDHEKEEQTHTLIEFFSIRCSDCLKNLPKVGEISEELGDKLTVRLVAVDKDVAAVREFIAQKGLQEAIAFDNEKQALRAYGVLATPTVFILDSENTVVFKHTGVLSEADIAEIHAIVGQ